jgi:hypothetical protein
MFQFFYSKPKGGGKGMLNRARKQVEYVQGHCYNGRKNAAIFTAYLLFFGLFVMGPRFFLG